MAKIKMLFEFVIVVCLFFITLHIYTSSNGEPVNQESDNDIVTDEPASSIDKFEYDGHSYIKIKDGNDVQVIHDPDCKCDNNE